MTLSDNELVQRVLELSSHLQRHFIGVALELSKESRVQRLLFSAFLFSIRDEWIIVTAGHCVEEVQDALNAGYILKGAQILDGMGLAPKFKTTIPFDYLAAEPISVHKEFDVGLMRVSANLRRLLAANGKSPLTEEAWECPPSDPEILLLVGIPSESTEEVGDTIFFIPSIYWVTEVARDDPFQETALPRLYGKVELGKGQEDIKGVSGGPIFSFKRTQAGQTRYWLAALQSSWNKADRRIAAPRTNTLGKFLQSLIAQIGTSDFLNAGVTPPPDRDGVQR